MLFQERERMLRRLSGIGTRHTGGSREEGNRLHGDHCPTPEEP